MDPAILAVAIEHIQKGFDIPAPESMLKVSAERAATQIPGAPYSLLTNLGHAVLWQRFWVSKLHGRRKKSSMEEWNNDFRVPEPAEWKALRSEFLEGLEEVRQICGAERFQHGCQTDEEAIDTVVRIVVHAAYHCGQMNLLKRIQK